MSGDSQLLQRLPSPTKRPGHALFMGVAGTGFSPIFFAPRGITHTFFWTVEYIAVRIFGDSINARPKLPAKFIHKPSSCSRMAICAQRYQQA